MSYALLLWSCCSRWRRKSPTRSSCNSRPPDTVSYFNFMQNILQTVPKAQVCFLMHAGGSSLRQAYKSFISIQNNFASSCVVDNKCTSKGDNVFFNYCPPSRGALLPMTSNRKLNVVCLSCLLTDWPLKSEMTHFRNRKMIYRNRHGVTYSNYIK